jgi:hypothetical protein
MINYYIDCIKQRPIHTINNRGTDVIVYSNSNIMGYIGSQQDKEAIVSDKVTIRTEYKFFSSHYDFIMGDRIIYENYVYEVIGDAKNTAHRFDHCRVKLKKIEGVKGG